MIKRHRTIEHLNSLILGSIENDKLDELRHYISIYPPIGLQQAKKSGNFLNYALAKCKYDSSKLLCELGFNMSNPEYILSKCTIQNIENVYKLLSHFDKSNKWRFDRPNNILMNKMINRILDPNKVFENPNRINVAMQYLESGFFTDNQFEESLNEISTSYKPSRYNGVINQLIREYKLKKLLEN